MTVLFPKHGLFYSAVPKVACTSVKHFFYTAQTGEIFDPVAEKRTLHSVWPSLLRENQPKEAAQMPHRVALVRPPLKRLVSAYRNRVGFHKELSEARVGPKLAKLGLEPDPSLALFVEHLELYQKANGSIFHHTRPMVDFLGHDPSAFSRIYSMQALPDFARDMNELMGTSVSLRHLQSNGLEDVSVDDLSAQHRKKLLSYYEADLDTFAANFG